MRRVRIAWQLPSHIKQNTPVRIYIHTCNYTLEMATEGKKEASNTPAQSPFPCGYNPNGDPQKKTVGEETSATDYTPQELKIDSFYHFVSIPTSGTLSEYCQILGPGRALEAEETKAGRTVLFTLTSVVVLVITTDWISWDKLNRGFLPSDEVSRAFLASFILVFDLLIVMQDWEFPHFMGDVEVNLPGLPSAHMQFKVPYFQKILKEEYHIHITGKWFNYGIIFLVLILDLNMWKNQIFYKPHEYGQYIGPGQKIYTVKDSESLKDLNRTKLSWEWRSNNTNPLTNRTYAEGDMFLHSRFTGSSLDVKCLAFIPSLLAFALFGFFIWFFGRFQKTDQGMENLDKSYTRMKRKSPSDMGMTRENTQVLEEPLSFQEPHLVSIKSDLSEIVFNSSLLTSENLNAQLNEQDSPLQPVPESSVPKSNPVT
ncbi:Transmembrane protein 117 [Pitangus sulphuratus]|nr:Transmembrane protein 117 [Pitangus sulphuratus]